MIHALMTAGLVLSNPLPAAQTPLTVIEEAAAQNLKRRPARPSKRGPAEKAGAAVPNAAAKEPTASESIIAPKTWGEVPEQSRYLIIMGTIDGMSAASVNQPRAELACFNGKTNSDIDKLVTAQGYAGTGNDIVPVLRANITAGATCDSTARGYDTKMIQGMNDRDLANYVGAAAAAYLTIVNCAEPASSIAESAARALLQPDADKSSVVVMAKAFSQLCPGETAPSGSTNVASPYGMSNPVSAGGKTQER